MQDSQPVNFRINPRYGVTRRQRRERIQTVLISSLIIALLFLASSRHVESAEANAPLNKNMDLSRIEAKVAQFLAMQTNGYPGDVKVSIVPLDRKLKLADCPNMDALMPNGSRPWGKTAVAVKCSHFDQSSKWTLYVQANVAVFADYVVAAEPLSQGQIIHANHVMLQKGDLTSLPSGVYTQLTQVIGSTAKMSLLAGSVLRQDTVKLPLLVKQGQTVTLSSMGNGFHITAQGNAMNNAELNQLVQVKMASGKLVSGIANSQGMVEVSAQ